MRATIDGPTTGSTAELGGWDAVARHRPRHAGRDPTIPVTGSGLRQRPVIVASAPGPRASSAAALAATTRHR
jgi:hypothetical protein